MDQIQTLHQAITALWPELPALIGNDWSDFKRKLEDFLAQLSTVSDPDQVLAIYDQIRLLFFDYEQADAGLIKLLSAGVDEHELINKGSRDLGRVAQSSTHTDSLTITRYTDIACPRYIWVETRRMTVVMRLTVQEPEYSVAVEALTELTEMPIQVHLTAPGFELLNANPQEIPILSAHDSPPIVFDLKPIRTGHTQLQFDFFQNGQPLRTVTVPVQITSDEVAQDEVSHAHQAVTTSGNVAPPDLVLHIGWNSERHSLEFTLIRDGGSWWRSFQPVSIHGNPADHASELYRGITSLVNNEDPTAHVQLEQRLMIAADDVDRQIRQLGYHLWHTLIPPDLRELYAAERDYWHDRSLLIYSDEPYLPWELIWPYDDTKGTWKDDAPWCVTTKLTRWLRRDAQGNGNEAPPGMVSLRTAAVLAPQYHHLNNLPLASLERDTLKTRFSAHQITDVSPKTASWSAVMDLLESGNYDWIHMASHGSFYAQAPTSDSAIWLDQDKALTPEHLGGPEITCHFRQKRPAFFFNACEVGRQGPALTRIGGWANQLISLNAGLFIGSLWTVSDSGAATFSDTFYSALLTGETIGKAVQKARLAACAVGDPTWLAYSVYAHPNARSAMSAHQTAVAP